MFKTHIGKKHVVKEVVPTSENVVGAINDFV